ncbi:hypothetical protein TNCT_680801 [Trichonephila clavata]|uniref:Uncharacterized protein n=1 Tax=Trichonephila clavata TaxID=2740835 RepID=A0A8X6IM42_TRICU|nr:hypothetical protein TNCT_680801 [Trichonephila clavata]
MVTLSVQFTKHPPNFTSTPGLPREEIVKDKGALKSHLRWLLQPNGHYRTRRHFFFRDMSTSLSPAKDHRLMLFTFANALNLYIGVCGNLERAVPAMVA